MMHRVQISAIAVLVVGMAACGDDGGGGDRTAACEAFVAIDEEMSINEDLEAGIAALEAFVASAPDDVASQVEPLVPLLRQDAEAAFESEELAVAETASDEWARDNCADTRVELETFNFAFPDVPTEVEAGRVAFTLTNRTQTDEAHEALLLRKNDDVEASAYDTLAAALEGRPVSVETTLGSFEQFTFVGAGLVEPPGDDGYDVFVVDLEPGDYVVACLLPVDSAELLEPYFAGEEVGGEYHLHRGMFAELTVT